MNALPQEEAGRSAGVHPAHRGSICLEDGQIVSQETWPGEQFVLRITAPKCAARALPGSFVHLTCDPDVPMRRPLSIQRANAKEGWIEILYKIVGPGLRALSRRRAGDTISVLGPIGQPFRPDPKKPRALLVGGGVGIPPMVFLAEWMLEQPGTFRPLVLMGSEIPFPFKTRPSTILVPGIPAGSIAAMPLLDGWGVPSRLASKAGFRAATTASSRSSRMSG
jgi:dihydroorotate dehydrogenase electron transfer subunit